MVRIDIDPNCIFRMTSVGDTTGSKSLSPPKTGMIIGVMWRISEVLILLFVAQFGHSTSVICDRLRKLQIPLLFRLFSLRLVLRIT